MLKPLILIPSATHPDRDVRIFANLVYIRAIEEAGGIVLLTGRPKDTEDLDRLMLLADGLLLMGGTDIHASEYGKENCIHVKDPDEERDSLELALLRKADKKGIPVLGICRGMQVMNVYAGGVLFRDLEDEHTNEVQHERHHTRERNILAHDVEVAPGTLLSTIIGSGTHQVNSLHHQGVSRAGNGLSPSAVAPDGLVEAIEQSSHPFWLGVQWHPEELVVEEKWKNIFTSFIHATSPHRE